MQGDRGLVHALGGRSGTSFLASRAYGRGICRSTALILAPLALLVASLAASASAAPAWHPQVLAYPSNLVSPGASGEVQNVAVNAVGGSFKLIFEGEPTAAITYGAPAATVQSALNALTKIGGAGGSVSVTQPGSRQPLNGQYVVTFGGTLHGPGVPQMRADSTLLSGGLHTATVALASEDGYEIKVENLGDTTSSGTTRLVDHLPPGVETTQTPMTIFPFEEWKCSEGAGQNVVTCESTATVKPATTFFNFETPGPGTPNVGLEPILIPVAVAPGGAEVLTNSVTVSGGGALNPATGSVTNPVNGAAQTFGVASLSFQAIAAQGAPFTQAGGHPYAVTTDLELNQAPGGLNAPLEPLVRWESWRCRTKNRAGRPAARADRRSAGGAEVPCAHVQRRPQTRRKRGRQRNRLPP